MTPVPPTDIDDEDLITHRSWSGKFVAIYNTPEGFFATDGMCTHEEESLGDGLVMDGVIECPLHQGRFCVRTGRALSAPAVESPIVSTYELHASENDRRVWVKV